MCESFDYRVTSISSQMKEVVHKIFERLWKNIEDQFSTTFEVDGIDPVEPFDRDLAQRMQEIDARVEVAAGRIREIRQEVSQACFFFLFFMTQNS